MRLLFAISSFVASGEWGGEQRELTQMKWFKFYGQDWLTDMKISGMSMEDRLCYITLLCLASSSEEAGVIRDCNEDTLIKLSSIPFDQIHDMNPEENARGCLKRFEDRGMITNDNGTVIIVHFKKRQETNLTGYERVRRFRENQKKGLNEGKSNDNTENVINDNVRLDKIRVDKKRTTNKGDVPSQDIQTFIELFKNVNPTYERLFGNKTERDASTRLIRKFGMEKMAATVSHLAEIITQPYAPRITTPYELERNLGKLIAFSKQDSVKNSTKVAFI